MAATSGVHVELSGRVRLVVGQQVVEGRALGGVVVRRVLAVLALAQRPVTKDELGDAVWGDRLPRTWETALRGAVHQLRRAVVAVDPSHPEIVRTSSGSYELEGGAVVDLVAAADDVERAEQALAAGDPDTAVVVAEDAARVLAEPLLPGLEGPWVDAQRRRFAPLQLRALLASSTAATAIGAHALAVQAATRAVDLDPFLETAHRRLMAANAAAGDRAAALLAYRRCRQALADELGLAPSEETEAVHRSMLGATDVLDELHELLAAVAPAAPDASSVPIVLGWVEAELGLASAPASVDRAVAAARALPRSAPRAGLVAIALEAAERVGHPGVDELAALLEPSAPTGSRPGCGRP